MPTHIPAFFNIGHRGAPLLVPPGNTLTGLLRAVEVGAQMLEVDVRRTRDDVLILDHENVHTIAGVEVPIRDRSLSHWQKYAEDEGYNLATLDEAFDLAAQWDVGLMLDFKEVGTEALLARAIRRSRFPLERLLVAGAADSSRRILRSLDPRIPLSLTLELEDARQITPKLLSELDTEAITWHYRLINPPIAEILQRREIRVYAWTVDTATEMRRLRDTCHVDGIITNSPDLLRSIQSDSPS